MDVESFGNVTEQKHKLMLALDELDSMAERWPLNGAEKNQKESIFGELDKLIFLEEISWRQKSQAI